MDGFREIWPVMGKAILVIQAGNAFLPSPFVGDRQFVSSARVWIENRIGSRGMRIDELQVFDVIEQLTYRVFHMILMRDGAVCANFAFACYFYPRALRC